MVMDLCSGKIIGYAYGTSMTEELAVRAVKNGILHSFSRKGNPYDNACIESFHSVLKKEEIYLHTYQDSKEARMAIFEYIKGWYNRKRIHSSIGYLTPQQKEDEELKKSASTECLSIGQNFYRKLYILNTFLRRHIDNRFDKIFIINKT